MCPCKYCNSTLLALLSASLCCVCRSSTLTLHLCLLQALLLVRQLGLVLPPPALQTVLRGAYRAYAANAKFVSPATLPALAFMAAGVVELSSLDLAVTYQVGVPLA
jgi:hypothetical protein